MHQNSDWAIDAYRVAIGALGTRSASALISGNLVLLLGFLGGFPSLLLLHGHGLEVVRLDRVGFAA